MTTKLIFMGGAPGVGKTAVARELLGLLDNCVWLDADDLWRMNPFVVNEHTKDMIEKSIQYLLNSYIEHGFSYIIFAWVLHSDYIVQGLLNGIGDCEYTFRHFTLLCDETTLKERISADTGRTTDPALAVKRHKQCLLVNSDKINSTDMTPLQIAGRIKKEISLA